MWRHGHLISVAEQNNFEETIIVTNFFAISISGHRVTRPIVKSMFDKIWSENVFSFLRPSPYVCIFVIIIAVILMIAIVFRLKTFENIHISMRFGLPSPLRHLITFRVLTGAHQCAFAVEGEYKKTFAYRLKDRFYLANLFAWNDFFLFSKLK